MCSDVAMFEAARERHASLLREAEQYRLVSRALEAAAQSPPLAWPTHIVVASPDSRPTTQPAYRARRAVASLVMRLVAALVVAIVPTWTGAVEAQDQDGATMTVLRGQVAVVAASGQSVQPARSGTVVRAGDEVRTLPDSGAAVTFFSGTEIELGERTTLVVERISRTGGQIDISLRQVFGVTLHRVKSLPSPGSAYRVDVGGAVALVRGTEFVLYGPTDENVVGIACLDDCDARTTFLGCPMAPRLGYWAQAERGRVVSPCQPFPTRGNPWNAPTELRLAP